MEKNKHPPSFLQDVHHLPRFPGGTVAQIGPPLWPLPPRGCRGFPEFSSIPHVFIEHLLYAKHCAGFLRECALLPSWCLWQLLGCGGQGCSQQGFWVVLNTCPFLLVASRYCGRKGVS